MYALYDVSKLILSRESSGLWGCFGFKKINDKKCKYYILMNCKLL